MKSKKIVKLGIVVFVGLILYCFVASTRVSKEFLDTLEFDGKNYVEHLVSDVEVLSKTDKLVSSTGVGISKKHRYNVVVVQPLTIDDITLDGEKEQSGVQKYGETNSLDSIELDLEDVGLEEK